MLRTEPKSISVLNLIRGIHAFGDLVQIEIACFCLIALFDVHKKVLFSWSYRNEQYVTF